MKVKEALKTAAVCILCVSLVCLCAVYMLLYQQSESAAFSKEDYMKLRRGNSQYNYADSYKSSFALPEGIAFASGETYKYLLTDVNAVTAAAKEISAQFFGGLFGENSVPTELSQKKGRELYARLASANEYIYMKYHTELPRSVIYRLSDTSRMGEDVSSEGIYDIFIFAAASYLKITPAEAGLADGAYLCAAARDLSGNYRLYYYSLGNSGDGLFFNKKLFAAYSNYEKITDFCFVADTDIYYGMSMAENSDTESGIIFRSGFTMPHINRSSLYDELISEENAEKLLRAFSMNISKIPYHVADDGTYTYYDEGKTFTISADGKCRLSVTSYDYAVSIALAGTGADALDYVGATAAFLSSLPLFSENAKAAGVSLAISEIFVGENSARISYGYLYNNIPVFINGKHTAASFEIYDGAITGCTLEFTKISAGKGKFSLSENRTEFIALAGMGISSADCVPAYAFDAGDSASAFWSCRYVKKEADGK